MQQPRLLEARRERRFHYQAELMLESVRRQTFSNWTVAYVDPDQLARAGFFYLRTLDHVQCVFCQGIVGYWDPGDDPDAEHKKHFPNCPFMTGVATGNIPSNYQDDDTGRVYRLLDEYHIFRVTSSRPIIKNTNYQCDASRVETGQLAYPQFNTISARKHTFKNWPNGVGVKQDALVAAGFFSIGLSEWVQCFHCGGGLFGWRQGDDPAADHLRYYPICPFIRLQEAEDKMNQTWGDNVPPPVVIRPLTLSESETNLLLVHPIAQRLVGMGLSKISVKLALKSRLESRGIICSTVTEALELVFDHDEQQRKKGLQHDFLSNSHQNNVTEMNHSQETSLQQSNISTGTSQTNDQYQTLTSQVDELRTLVCKEESRLRCRICKSEKVAVVLQPCSHLHLCATCARPRDTCPTCGAVIRGTLRPIIS